MSYWALNSVFLAVVAAVAAVAAVRERRRTPWRAVALALGCLLLTTAVFDNVMIAIGLVGYDPHLVSGARLGIAPLEDFAYAIAAAILLPSVWMLAAGAGRRAARGTIPESGRATDGSPHV